jgi:hypothetical protein
MAIHIVGSFAIGYRPSRPRHLFQTIEALSYWERDLERVGTFATTKVSGPSGGFAVPYVGESL